MPPISLDPASVAGRTVAELDREGPELTPFVWLDGTARRHGLLLRTSDGPRAFENRCPHWNVPLTHLHDDILRGATLRCSVHAAEFAVDDGACTAGPCQGSALLRLAVREEGDSLHVLAPTAAFGGLGGGV